MKNISSHVSWVYDTPPSLDSNTSKSKLSSNVTFFVNSQQPWLLCSNDVIILSFPTKGDIELVLNLPMVPWTCKIAHSHCH